jgi:hypothetical protein
MEVADPFEGRIVTARFFCRTFEQAPALQRCAEWLIFFRQRSLLSRPILIGAKRSHIAVVFD